MRYMSVMYYYANMIFPQPCLLNQVQQSIARLIKTARSCLSELLKTMPSQPQFYNCHVCEWPYAHGEMWPSRRAVHIEQHGVGPGEYTKYYRICYKCEARLQLDEMSDPATKEFWQTDEGWHLHLANIKHKMALDKRKNHTKRGSLFAEACKEVKVEHAQRTSMNRKEKRAKVPARFHEKLTDMNK